jgi:hypothetical protein
MRSIHCLVSSDLLVTVSDREELELVQTFLAMGGSPSEWASGQMSLWGSQRLASSLNGPLVVAAFTLRVDSGVVALLVHQKLI